MKRPHNRQKITAEFLESGKLSLSTTVQEQSGYRVGISTAAFWHCVPSLAFHRHGTKKTNR